MNYRMLNVRSADGFTLIELLVAIAVLAILLTIAVPSVQQIMRDGRVTSQTNEVIALVNLTRNEAIRRGIDASDADEALLRLDSTASGWTGNVSVTDAATAEGCPAGVIRCSANTNVALTTTNNELSFESRGYLRQGDGVWQTETICLKHQGTCMGDRQHVRIRILPSGQIETDTLTCDAACGGAEG